MPGSGDCLETGEGPGDKSCSRDQLKGALGEGAGWGEGLPGRGSCKGHFEDPKEATAAGAEQEAEWPGESCGAGARPDPTALWTLGRRLHCILRCGASLKGAQCRGCLLSQPLPLPDLPETAGMASTT